VHLPKAKSRNETGRRIRFYVALGLVTAATLMLQIIETRIISVISWYHLAFFVIPASWLRLHSVGGIRGYRKSNAYSEAAGLILQSDVAL